MAYPNRGLQKAAMGHYLTESARTALEALELGNNATGPVKQMPAVGPNQLLDMPLFAKMPFLPGSNTMFYRASLGEKLYQTSPMFHLTDPYCKIMAPSYNSLHDPHLRAFYKRKDNIRRLKKAGLITENNKVVCTLKEFNEYRQYLTSLKLEFEKNYIRDQKMLEKQVTKLQDSRLLPEAADTSKYRDWLLKEERPTIQEQESVMRNRYLELINQELEKLEQLAEENQHLLLAQDDKKKQGLEKRKQLLLRKKIEEEWRKKEVMLLKKIGAEVKREARVEEQRKKSQEDKLKRKQAMLEKKMALHLRKLQERFQKEGLLPPGSVFCATTLEDQGPEAKRPVYLPKKTAAGSNKSLDLEKKSIALTDSKEMEFPKGSVTEPGSQASLAKAKSQSQNRLSTGTLEPKTSWEPMPSKSASGSLEQSAVPRGKNLSKKESRNSEPTSKVSFASAKEVVSMASGSSNDSQAAVLESGGGSSTTKVTASASGGHISNEGDVSACGSAGGGSKTSCGGSGGCGSKTSCGGPEGCGSKTSCGGPGGCGSKTSCGGPGRCDSKTSCGGPGGCGSKTSCCGSGGCGSKTSCCGSGGCGSKTSCCGSGRCGSKTSCCGSGGCGSKTSCCGSGGCGSKTSCCGSGGCGSKTSFGGSAEDGSKTSCCGSAGCCSLSGKAAGGYDSSGSSRHRNSSATSKVPPLPSAGADPLHQSVVKTTTEVTMSSAISQRTGSEGSSKAKHKKTATFLGEAESHSKERSSSKKRRVKRGKTEHVASTSQENEDSESSYSAYLHHLLSNSDQSVIRESLKGKVSVAEQNSIIQNIMTWVVSAVTSILYPALVKFEERIRTKAFATSEESALSSDNSSSCSTCNEDLPETYSSLPTASAPKVSCTDTSFKPTTSSPSELQTTTSSMRSSKSDSHIFQLQKGGADATEKPATSHHNKHRHVVPRGLLSKTETTATDTEEVPLGGGEYKPPHGPRDPGETICLRDLKSILDNLKSNIIQTTAIILEDVFKRILGDLGFTVCSISITLDVLLEAVSESLLGSPPEGSPIDPSVSRIASFVASNIVEKVLNTLHSTAQKKYLETISTDEFSAVCKAMCIVATGKHTVPDPAFWRARVPLSFEAAYGIAEEIVHAITEKLKVFTTSSQTKLSQFELCAKIKASGIPLEQVYTVIPPHTVESEAANAIVKDTIRKIVSKTVASSETHIVQYVEEIISSVLSYIQRQMSQEGILPRRESSVLLQLINDIFNDLSLENLRGISPSAKSRASPETQGGVPAPETKPGEITTTTTTTLHTAAKVLRRPFPPISVPGMIPYSEAEVEGKKKREPGGTLLSVSKEQKVLGMEEAQDKTRNESFGLESRQRNRPGTKSAFQGEGAEQKTLEKTENGLESLVQEAIFCSLEGQGTVKCPVGQTPRTEQAINDGGWTLQLALKKMEGDFKEGEQSPLTQIVWNLLNEIFQHLCTEHPIWPPAAPPPSLTYMSIPKQQPDEQPASKGQLSGPAPISDADAAVFTGDLVKTVFQKLSCATLADAPDARSRRSSLVITDIFPPNRSAEAQNVPPIVHFRNPEMSFESGPTKGGATNTTEDPTRTSQPDLHNLPSKSELAGDLVQICIEKVEAFVTSKVESQFCSDMQNLKTSTSANFPAAIHQDLRQFPATLPNSLGKEMSYNNLLLDEKKTQQALPLSYSNLKTYAQEVAKRMLKSLKHELDKEVEKILISPVIFSESIAASQIINMVLAVFSPHETPSKFSSVFKFSDWNIHGAPERSKRMPSGTSGPQPRPPGRRRQDRSSSRFKLDLLQDDWLPKQSSIPEDSILGKLLKKVAESEGMPRFPGPEPPSNYRNPFLQSPPLRVPEGTCYSDICPLKLSQTAETIVNTLLCEFGLENEPVVQASHYQKFGHRFPLKERALLGVSGPSVVAEPKQKKQSLLKNLWEKRLSKSSEKMTSAWTEETNLLSRWESERSFFGNRGPERLMDLELRGCAHMPGPCEMRLLANHIVLTVIKALLMFQPRDSLPAWRQELLQSESTWLQERIWRSCYLPSSRKPSSWLDLFWEPLTQAVVSNLLLSVSDSSARKNVRNEFFERSPSMFCSVDVSCPERRLRAPQSPPLNMEDLAFHISDVIIGILCERNILHGTINRKRFSGRKTNYIHVPPLCLADFEEVYQPLVKEVDNLLSLEIGSRCTCGSKGKTRGVLAHQHLPSHCFSGASRGDCRGPSDVRGMTRLSMMGPVAHKNQRLCCVTSNLDNFIRSLKTSESKHLVNKVLHIILDSLWPSQSQGSFLGPFSDAAPQNMMPYRDADLPSKRHLLSSSVCPHAYRLGNNVLGSNLGLSPKSLILLDTVSEKLIRTLLDKCLMTEHFTFDEFPEDEQICDTWKCIGDDELFESSSREMRAYTADSSSSVFTYNIKYAEEPEEETESEPSSYESALDVLAHTLVKPVMTELSLSVEHPGHLKMYTTKKPYRRKVVVAAGHGDHSQLQPAFSVIYSDEFLEELISQLLIKIFSSLSTKYDSDSCIDLNEMNRLFVNALVEELNKAGVGILQRAEEKVYFPQVDGQTVQKIVDSILQELGFKLAADGAAGKDIDSLAELAAEVILMEILDYQLPPPLCWRLPQNAYKTVKAERIICRIEDSICFPAVQRKRQPPPTYVTVLSQKYLERVINRFVAQLFPPSDGVTWKQDKGEMRGVDLDELCSYLIKEVMMSISKHKIWVARKDDQCCLHSEKETQRVVDSVYKSMLKKSGSQLAMQKDAKSRRNAFVDSMTSFIIQEITSHHLQTFLSKDEHTSGTPDPDALSKNIVRTVLNSLSETSASCAGVFPAKFLEEIVYRVLSKVLRTSSGKKAVRKGQREDELSKVVKKLASSINLQFGKTTGPESGSEKRGEQSLGAPLTSVMDDVVDSVCSKILREREAAPKDSQEDGSPSGNAVFENVKRLIGKDISDYLLHPLFSGDLPKASLSSPSEDVTDNVGDGLQEVQEENESQSPFSTFLSSGFLRDIITGLLSKIFPSAPAKEATSPWETKRLPSESDLSKLSTQLLDDVRVKLLKHEIRVTKDAPLGQYEYSDEDVQNMTDSLCSKIIQKSGSLEAVQREVRKKSSSLIDRIAGFLVGDLLQKHVQPFVSGQESPTWDRAAAGDSMRGLEVSRGVIKPLDRRQASQDKRGSPAPSPSLGQIIRELFSNITNRFSDVPLGASRDDLGDTAIRLAKSVTNILGKTHLSVQESPVEELGSPPEGRGSSAWKLPNKEMSGLLSDDERDSSSCQMTTMTFEEPADQLNLQSAGSPVLAEAKCLIQKRLMTGPAGPLTRPPVPYTTVLSYPVLEAILDRLLSQIFPSPSSTAACSDDKDSPFGPEPCKRIVQIKKDIMMAVLKQAIWISTYGNEVSISEEAMERMVESVYCDVLHEVMLQQPLQEDRESLSNLYVTKIACFIVNEMFKYHLRSFTSEEEPPPLGASVRDLPASCVTVFPCRLLEEMLSQLLVKIFPNPESITAYTGSLAEFSDSDFMEMATNLKSYVITEISAHEIKLENVSQRIPDMDQETEEDIASSVYNQILQKSTSQSELQDSLTSQGKAAVYQLANLLIREILNFHLHPFLSGNHASSGEGIPHHQEQQPFSHHIYSAMFLEDVVVAFFCKMLSSPNILVYSKHTSLPESEMRNLVVELVNALISEFKALDVKVIQSEDEDLPFPQVTAEEVVEISNSVYEKLAQNLGSELDIFKAFQNDGPLLAEKLAPLIVSRVSGYQFQPLFTGDTSSYLFSFLEAETIVDRVETILPETTNSSSSSGMFKEMFGKILHRIFPSWAPQRSAEELDPTVGEAVNRSIPIEPMKDEAAFEADRSIQNLVENICKTICPKSGSLKRQYGSGTAEELADFTSKARADRCMLESPSPPNQTHPSSMLGSKAAGWTMHQVKLGDAELQTSQAEGRSDVYSSAFLKDIFSGLVSKLLSSTASVCLLEKKESEAEPAVETLVESILKAFARSPVKVLQIPERGQTSPAVGQREIAKIIHASLCGILQDWGGGTPIFTDKESDHALAERLANSIKKEILGYQIQGNVAKSPQASASQPFEFGEMARKVLTEVRKTNTPSQTNMPYPLLVSQRFVDDVLEALLTQILPLPDKASASDNSEDHFAEFDFIHMKLLSKVMAKMGKDKNTMVQYLERCQPNPFASQSVANSVYGNLLPEFGTVSALEKCIKAGCTILFERIADLVIKEISGNQMQMYFSEELNRQQEAEAERPLEDDDRDVAELPEGETLLRCHLRGLSSIVIEEVAAKLLSKMFHAIPLDDIESSSISAMKEVAKKILNSLQGLISKKKLRVWQQDDVEDLGLEDRRAVGEVVDSVYTDIIKYSGSETSLYDELTNENDDFVNRVACVMVSEISRHDFQPFLDAEDELPRPSTSIKLETDKIIRKFLSDMELEKAKKEHLAAQTLSVSVLFMEEILSRFLTRVVLIQRELATVLNKSWSRAEVNDIADQLKASVEKEMSRNKISLVALEHQETLDPEDEAKVDQVVHSVFSNVLEISGSHQEMCNDITTTKVIFPEQVASIIVNEISSYCSISNPFAENVENEICSTLVLDRIVSKVLAQVSCHVGPEEETSLSEVSPLTFPPEDTLLLPDTEELPVKIVPCIGQKALKIDPEIISNHLAVLSIKTEPLEKLERECLSKVGMSLAELRRVSTSGKSLSIEAASDPHKKKERRPSLDVAGHLDVKPRDVVCRNSFRSLMRPDIRKVELLRDVESKHDLIVRLVAHDISDSFHITEREEEEEEESKERVLREDRSFFFEVPSAQYEGKMPEPVAQASPPASTTAQLAQGSSQTEVPTALTTESDENEKTLEEAVVDMHLTRDTETTSGPFEITSVYQDKKITGATPGDTTEEEKGEAGRAIKTTSSEAAVPTQQRSSSSVLKKVSSALSRVFS